MKPVINKLVDKYATDGGGLLHLTNWTSLMPKD